MLNMLRDMFGRRKSVEQDLAQALVRAAEAIDKAVEVARVRSGMPPRPWPSVPPKVGGILERYKAENDARPSALPAKMEPPFRKDECQADERCGFPLHLPPTAEGGPSYPPHHAVKISGDSTECLDCGVRWDTNNPEPPALCVPKDPMKYMYDAGFTDFPFKKPKTEVTSDKPHPMESLARNLFEQARCFKTDGRTHYEINPMVAYQAVLTAINWLGETPFVSSGHAAVDELEQLIAAHLPGANHSTFLTTSFAEVLIRWCERHPLN